MSVTAVSDKGLVELVAEEGEVLHAYRDSVGVLTIGVGLTAASGVVKPAIGMVITREQSRALLAQALAKTYSPAVAGALPTDRQNVFDGASLFHWNTGAIRRAGWVPLYRSAKVEEARSSFLSWSKAGGRVLPALASRRGREWNLIVSGVYAHAGASLDQAKEAAVLKQGDSGEAVLILQGDLTRLGLFAGMVDGRFGPDLTAAVMAFQRAHPVLAVDGRAGPATLTTLARTLAAVPKVGKAGLGAGAAAGGSVGAGQVLGTGAPLWLVLGLVLVTLAAMAWTAWRYRDEFRALFNRS